MILHLMYSYGTEAAETAAGLHIIVHLMECQVSICFYSESSALTTKFLLFTRNVLKPSSDLVAIKR